MEIISKKQRDTHIRPTSGKIREAIFNLLKHGKFRNELDFLDNDHHSLVEDRVITDMFSGTGILGFECLSRGASTVVFVDQSDESLRIAQANAKKFEMFERCIFSRSNATNLGNPPVVADVIFMDPPYDKNLVMPCLKSIAERGWIKEGGLVIAEHSKKEKILDLSHFKILDSRPYNNTVITFLIRV